MGRLTWNDQELFPPGRLCVTRKNYAVYVEDDTRPPRPVQLVWKNSPRGLSKTATLYPWSFMFNTRFCPIRQAQSGPYRSFPVPSRLLIERLFRRACARSGACC